LQKRGWPLPSVAGGIHPGMFHVVLELLGPRLAFFVGGGIALHPKGPVAGGEYWRACLDAASGPCWRRDADWSNPPEVLQRCATEYGASLATPSDEFQYINPIGILDKAVYTRWIDR